MSQKWLLALETSGKGGSVALSNDCDCIDFRMLESEFGSAKTLAPAIESSLRAMKCLPSQLSAIAVTAGPGSFTGLRVGVTIAKVMAFALQIPVCSIDSLDALVHRFVQESAKGQRDANIGDRLCWTVLDAYRGQLFVASWTISKGIPERQSPTCLIAASHWIQIVQTEQRDQMVVGPTATRLESLLGKIRNAPRFVSLAPSAIEVNKLGWQHFRQQKTMEASRLMPHYLRRSAAEEKALAETK